MVLQIQPSILESNGLQKLYSKDPLLCQHEDKSPYPRIHVMSQLSKLLSRVTTGELLRLPDSQPSQEQVLVQREALPQMNKCAAI